MRSFVNDSTGLTNETVGPGIKIHNSNKNPPHIELVTPQGGRVVDKTQVITARVRDLDDNIDPNGVFYYYSPDKESWHYLDALKELSTIRVTTYSDYDYFWSTDLIHDGEYYLKVSVSDLDGFIATDELDEPIIVHNSNDNPPFVRLLTPTKGQYINGTFKVQAYAFDLENNIANTGLSFLFSTDKEDWNTINNVGKPIPGTRTYELAWDTLGFDDGKYWLRVDVKDTDGLTATDMSDYFFIHNSENNPPSVTFIWPQSGEHNGTIRINASVFDLENNLVDSGLFFEYSLDKKTWEIIGSDPTPRKVGDEVIYEFNWDTTTVPDNMYWLRARALDLTNLENSDGSKDYIIIHNNRNNPPIVKLISPTKGEPLTTRESLVAEVVDFENDVQSVSFYYSKDNKTWVLIDSRQKPEAGTNRYRTIWITDQLKNGEYFLKVKATDQVGNIVELVDGPFKVTEGKSEEPKDETSGFDDFLWVIIIVILVVVMLIIILLMLRRSKRREEQLIEEVAAEAQRSRVLDGEIESVPVPGLPESVESISTADALQTYIPPQEAQKPLPTPTQTSAPQLPAYTPQPEVETIESYNQQLALWKAEGYNVSRLEQLAATDETMFSKVFPVFSSNITRLKNLSTKLDSIDTIGHESELDSIRAKLYEPDQALLTEKEFTSLTDKINAEKGFGEKPVEQNIDEISPDISLPADEVVPPDIELPPEPTEPPEIDMPMPTDTESEQAPPTTTPEPETTETQEEKKDIEE